MKLRSLLVALFAVSLLSAVAAAADSEGILGAWDLTLDTPDGARPSWVKLFENGDGQLAAEFVGPTGGKNPADEISVDGNAARWVMGGAVFEAELTDDGLAGVLVQGEREIPFTGQRVIRDVNVGGEWTIDFELGGQPMQRTLKLEHDGDKIAGTYDDGENRQYEIYDAELNGRDLSFSFDIEYQGSPFVITYEVETSGDRFKGAAVVEDQGFEIPVEGTRQRQWGEPVELFNGTDLSNWDYQQVGGDNEWKVVDGVMVNEKAGWNIFSKQKFSDYKLSIDFKVPNRGNSGVYLNGRYEVQVADTHGQEPSVGGIGAIYGRAVPTANPSKPADEWQTFEITFVDYWATVTLNGKTIVDNVMIEGITGGALDSRESEPGPLMLQGDHGHIEYRNIVITPLAD